MNEEIRELLIQLTEKVDRLLEEKEPKKEVMSLVELTNSGYSRRDLLRIFRTQGSKGIAWKTGSAPNCPIYFDVSKLEKAIKAKCVAR